MSNKKKKQKLPEEQQVCMKTFYPKNRSQQLLIESIEENEVTVAIGVAGSGKTYVSIATALSLLGDVYRKIILIKSVTPIPGENIGYLPGGIEDKMDPYLMSFTWNIDKIIGKGAAKDLMHKEMIEVLPLAYVRGLSIDNSIVILDESQNFDSHTFKTIITRIGENSKYIFLGDVEQVDRKNKQESCLSKVLEMFENSGLIGTVRFTDEDCVRNPIIPKVLEVLRENGV